VAEYEKANRYGSELSNGVKAGSGGAVFRVGGLTVLALICADFWHWRPGSIGASPDIVVVPAFSVTRRARPHMARARWRHQAVAKAYELTAFVGISDWAPSVIHADGRGSGAAGLARPDPPRVRELFSPLGARRVAAFEVDMSELSVLRADRVRRGFMHDIIQAPEGSAS
jgi:predicted amidohydrolase